MIHLVDAPLDRRRGLASMSGAPLATVRYVARGLSPRLMARFGNELGSIASRWGASAASSLIASLGAAVDSPTYLIRVREFGRALAWVEVGEGMMRPLTFASWFSFEEGWCWMGAPAGLHRLLRENAEAVLADTPQHALDALRAAVPELTVSGSPRVDLAQRTISFDEARYHGCIGPGSLSVSEGTFTLRTQRTEQWSQPSFE